MERLTKTERNNLKFKMIQIKAENPCNNRAVGKRPDESIDYFEFQVGRSYFNQKPPGGADSTP